MNIKSLFLACAALGLSVSASAQTPKLNANNIDEVVNAMTLHEKALYVVGGGSGNMMGAQIGYQEALVPGAAGITIAIPRLGIPSAVLPDGPAGLRINPTRDFDSKTYYCTHFPIGTCLSSSWNIDLVRQVGNAIGNEVLEYGGDVLLAPAMNIHRNPMCGRNFEYYSEDPVLAGEIAAAYINGIQDEGVGTSLKHFAFNSQETRRMGNDAQLSQRAAREIYLKGFQIAIQKAQPWTVMSSYNKVNGEYTPHRRDLMTTILRGEWGFKGLVMTDWGGGPDAVKDIYAGNDLIEPGNIKHVEAIEEAVKNGKLDVKYLNESVKRILEMVVKTPRFKGYKYSDAPDLKAHAQVTRNSAAEGIVLLKNEGLLPFGKNVKNVAVYGCTSYDIIPGGTGSGNVNRAYTVSLIEGLRNNGYIVDKSLINSYKIWLNKWKKDHKPDPEMWWRAIPRATEIVPSAEDLSQQVVDNDVAILTLGRISGEGTDRKAEDFNLTNEERQLINAVTNAFHKAGKKVVVVLNVGGVMETASWKNIPDAILLPWQCGQEGGNSIADILSGRLTPSGKLPMTWPNDLLDHPSSKNFPLDPGDWHETFGKVDNRTDRRNIDYTVYEEGIYVGYRYFDSFGKDVSYPFGYGLSYTTFNYGQPTVKDLGDKVEVSVTITNSGNHAGKEIAQVYVKAPKGKVEKPAQELKAFAKTRTLQPCESQTLTMRIKKIDLASFVTSASSWVADKGVYTFEVGANSRDIKGTATLNLTKDVKQKVNNVLKPQVKIKELSQKDVVK